MGKENAKANNQIAAMQKIVIMLLCSFLNLFLLFMTPKHLSTLNALTVYTPTIIPTKSSKKNNLQPISSSGQLYLISLIITIGILCNNKKLTHKIKRNSFNLFYIYILK